MKEFLKREVSYESMEKFMDHLDTILCYAVCITGLILIISLLIR